VTPDQRLRWLAKPAAFAACSAPLVVLAFRAFEVGGLTLGTNPVAELIHELGRWGLNLLLVTLAITPLRQLTGWPHWLRFRRLVGLWAFAYVALHMAAYAVIDQGLAWEVLVEDVLKRPWITIGLAGFLLLLPLALTSTRGWMRRLGRRWQTLHYAIYPATALGVWHFYWQVKQDVTEPVLYALGFALLMGWRWRHARRRAAATGGLATTAAVDARR
jgi:sulfoxide reductase heme-binding subunit YedZ